MNWKLKKAKIIAMGIAHNALVVLVHASNVAVWAYILYWWCIGE